MSYSFLCLVQQLIISNVRVYGQLKPYTVTIQIRDAEQCFHIFVFASGYFTK